MDSYRKKTTLDVVGRFVGLLLNFLAFAFGMLVIIGGMYALGGEHNNPAPMILGLGFSIAALSAIGIVTQIFPERVRVASHTHS